MGYRNALFLALILATTLFSVRCKKGRDSPTASSETGNTSQEPPIRPEAKGGGPLFSALDHRGRQTVFQLLHDGTAGAVAGLERGSLLSGAVAEDGTGGAFLLNVDGKRLLIRAQFGGEARFGAVDLGERIQSVRAVSTGAQHIVVETFDGDLLVARAEEGEATARRIKASALGKLMYRVAISRDGAKLAFSTMDRPCSKRPLMARCGVTLFGLDLSSGEQTPRKLAGGGKVVAYDPQLLDVDGASLTFMSNKADASTACADHVNSCMLAVYQMPFSGGTPDLVAPDAVHARQGLDTTLTYRQLGHHATGGQKRTFSQQKLFVVLPRGEKQLISSDVGHWLHHLSPDSLWIAVPLSRGGEESITLFDRTGTAHATVRGEKMRVLGYLDRALAAGARKLGESEVARALSLAKEIVAEHGSGEVGYWGLTEPTAVEGVQFLAGHRAARRWLVSENKTLVASRGSLCGFLSRMSEPRFVASLGGGLFMAGQRGSAPKAVPAEEPVASLRFEGKGSVTLLAAVLPKTVKGRYVPVTLLWRVETAPAVPWKTFVHIDSGSARAGADHSPTPCGIHNVQPNTTIEDVVYVDRASLNAGTARVYVGLYSGSKRAKVSDATVPVSMDRAYVGDLLLE